MYYLYFSFLHVSTTATIIRTSCTYCGRWGLGFFFNGRSTSRRRVGGRVLKTAYQEVFYDLLSAVSVRYFGMKLHAEEVYDMQKCLNLVG